MEVVGNVDALKKAIDKKYASLVKDAEKKRDTELATINKDLEAKKSSVIGHLQTQIEAEVKKTRALIVGDEQLKAKKKFEEKREALIDAVFKKALKEAKNVAHEDKYLKYVATNAPSGDLKIVADSKDLIDGCDVDKSIIGVKYVGDEVTYDFTLDNMIATRKDILRHRIGQVLFK